jgi:hypothetical protein
MVTSNDHREQVMKTVRGVRSDTDDLKSAAAMAAATVDVAVETAAEVNAQGDKLRSMKDRVLCIDPKYPPPPDELLVVLWH